MRVLTQADIDGMFYAYLAAEGWLREKVTPENWREAKAGDLLMDLRPLPHAPHVQAERSGLDLVVFFWGFSSAIPSPGALLSDPSLTLGEIAVKIHDSQLGAS
jgi:hypothetical protein